MKIYIFISILVCLLVCSCASGLLIAPSDVNVYYVGRVDKSNGSQYVLAWSGVQFSVLVTGTTTFSAVLDSVGETYYSVYIGTAMYVLNISSSTPQPYSISETVSLDPTQTYNITFIKRSEAEIGISTFYGFLVDNGASLLPYPKARGRAIEFIGDSITCGYGMIGVPPCSFQPDQEDITLTYGGIIAQELNAQFYVEAWSGKGIVKNYGSTTIPSNETFPELYPLTIPTQSTDYWDFNDFLPDAVVINLGSNDYEQLPHPSQHLFESTFIEFINYISTKYSDKPTIFLICGPMIGNPCCQYIQNIAVAISAVYIDMQDILKPNDYGCAGHPGVEGHAKMAAIALPIIQKNMGW
ncbi:hypothetical protein CYY_007798 [Polysphondylium violaceum]|uniref:Carbohydrate esterase 2 N-terminal domain-containing protein n=1 Tax=Polysphondylium violaceum TaxID=133409 RepID=A0A8J4PQC0_9MYCE|nr:hypothetical protein CYY_007798 [Polysphondylium violaceum]